jgi:Ca2+-binding EF-hand superfamily protein
MGIDPSKSVNLKKVVQKIQADRKTEEEQRAKEMAKANRKIPGFGVEKEKVGVPGFADRESDTLESIEQKYGDKVIGQVDSTLNRYDQNRNGMLDPEEIKLANWGAPPPQVTDRNKDGRISRLELAIRYRDRTVTAESTINAAQVQLNNAQLQMQNVQLANGQPGQVTVQYSHQLAQAQGAIVADQMAAHQNAVAMSVQAAQGRNPSNATMNPDPNQAAQDRYRRYAEGLMKQYDKDKDGNLNAEELKSMRRPPANADANSDGLVTLQELLESVSSRAPRQPSGPPAGEPQRGGGDEENQNMHQSPYNRNVEQSEYAGTVDLGGVDKNSDGQIQMHEFTEDWDEQKLAEFKSKDLNGDGVITQAEWMGR